MPYVRWKIEDSWWCFKITVAEHDPESGQSGISNHWLQPSVCISWSSYDKVSLILGIDIPPAVQEIVKDAFESGHIDRENPYSWHEFLIRTMSELYDFSFWKLRDLRGHSGFCRAVSKVVSVGSNVAEGQLDIELQDLLYAKLARCGALRDRISSEINLSKRGIHDEDDRRHHTQFFPSSLVAAILGMNDFDFSKSNNVETSPKICIVFVVSFILTVATFGIWLVLLQETKKLTPLSEENRISRERGIERQSPLLKRLNKSRPEIMANRF
ncbi:uncharacterized protein IWZ02DRAFT_505461 [Phyllosticta citriasiana]|uniref:uncharacterized protein n=1 Tax=Phyllosticta citriasiana TaxID=595635 RepID=UPI0030FDB8AF